MNEILLQKLIHSLINIIGSYTLPEIFRNDNFKELLEETNGIYTRLDNNTCFDISGMKYHYDLKNTKIMKLDTYPLWDIIKLN